MEKEFNVTGNCIPEQHYMADVSAKFKAIFDLVKKGKYFTINRPRQYGKTTMLFRLTEALWQSGEYVVFRISFEGVGDDVFKNEMVFSPMFFRRLSLYMQYIDKPLAAHIQVMSESLNSMEELSSAISELVQYCAKKVVLLIDEVDKSSNNQLFVSFLGMLRDKYLLRAESPTFHSVVLAGVHNVKNLKLKLRPDEEKKYNSPWNIAADFEVDMNLQPFEIVPMLEEYAHNRKVTVDASELANQLFYYTSGHPFLVSKLCKIFDEKLLPQKTEKSWEAEDIKQAVALLLHEDNTNFQDITKNLDNNEQLYDLTYRILIDAERVPFTTSEPIIQLGVLYGIYKDQHHVAIHNRIYAEYITAHMTARLITGSKAPRDLIQFSGTYTLPDGHLNMEKLLLRFQDMMREEYQKKDQGFLERQGRLVFLAFLKPILNGHGHSFKEPQISEEKRLDIAITFNQHKYVAELKLWRGQKAHEAGLRQLADYLDRQNLDKGYLIVFDQSETKEWKKQSSRIQGKKIFVVWV